MAKRAGTLKRKTNTNLPTNLSKGMNFGIPYKWIGERREWAQLNDKIDLLNKEVSDLVSSKNDIFRIFEQILNARLRNDQLVSYHGTSPPTGYSHFWITLEKIINSLIIHETGWRTVNGHISSNYSTLINQGNIFYQKSIGNLSDRIDYRIP